MRRVAALLVLVSIASGAAAQRAARPHRSGLWGELGSGPGHVRVACSGCSEIATGGAPSSHVRIGGTVSDNVLVGFEAFSLLGRTFGFAAEDSATAETVTAAVIVLWYPTKRGFFFKGGVGAAVGEVSIRTTATQRDTTTGGGIGLTFGVGWDWPISRKFAITGNLGTYVTALGDVVLPGRRVDDVIATMYSAAIGFTFR